MPDDRDPEWNDIARRVARVLGADVTGVQEVAGGLGTRRFYRVTLGGKPASVIARVEADEDAGGRPAGVAPEPALEPIRALLERSGLPVPRRFGPASDDGFDVLEDLGDVTLERALREAGDERRRALTRLALELIPRLQRIEPVPGVAAFDRRLGPELFAYKAELFGRYSLALALGRDASPAERGAVGEAFAWIASRCAEAPQRLAHRDFQSQNLLVREDEHGLPRIAMIDLQGAFLAPPEYDGACLLRDSYVERPEDEILAHRDELREALPDRPELESSNLRFDLLTLTRKGKDHARFLYAARERGDSRFLSYVPSTTRALRSAARRAASAHASLARLAELIERLPAEAPPCAP